MKNKENTEKEIKLEKLMDSFWNENGMNFMQYFEKHREEKLLNREDYHELEEQYKNIANQFPKALDFLENENVGGMTLEEQNAILELIDLKESEIVSKVDMLGWIVFCVFIIFGFIFCIKISNG